MFHCHDVLLLVLAAHTHKHALGGSDDVSHMANREACEGAGL